MVELFPGKGFRGVKSGCLEEGHHAGEKEALV